MLVCCVVLWCAVLCRAVVCCGVLCCGVVWCGVVVLVVLVVYSVQLVSLRGAEVEQLCQVKRMIGGIVNKTREDEREERKREREKERKRERARERERKRKRERKRQERERERERPPVCAFNTSPCVRSKCPRVYRQHAHMFFCPSPKINYYNPAPELSFSKKKLIN